MYFVLIPQKLCSVRVISHSSCSKFTCKSASWCKCILQFVISLDPGPGNRTMELFMLSEILLFMSNEEIVVCAGRYLGWWNDRSYWYWRQRGNISDCWWHILSKPRGEFHMRKSGLVMYIVWRFCMAFRRRWCLLNPLRSWDSFSAQKCVRELHTSIF